MNKSIGLNKKTKRKPQDYPQLTFRVSNDIKVDIMDEVEQVVEGLNLKRSEDDYVIRKNDVIIEALKIGLKHLKKKI